MRAEVVEGAGDIRPPKDVWIGPAPIFRSKLLKSNCILSSKRKGIAVDGFPATEL